MLNFKKVIQYLNSKSALRFVSPIIASVKCASICMYLSLTSNYPAIGDLLITMQRIYCLVKIHIDNNNISVISLHWWNYNECLK